MAVTLWVIATVQYVVCVSKKIMIGLGFTRPFVTALLF